MRVQNLLIKSKRKFSKFDVTSAGFDYKLCSILLALDAQSPNIAAGVHENRDDEDVGAGDQVIC